MSAEKKIVTKAEMQEHNTAKSLWISIHNQVYDISEFLDEVLCACFINTKRRLERRKQRGLSLKD